MIRIHASQRSSRGGFTLMEMLLVITAIAALSATGAVLIGLLMSAESRGTEEFVVQTTMSRLARQLRTDVHGAVSADVTAAGDAADAQLNLQLGDESTVRYVAEEGLVIRELDRGGNGRSRDEYVLPEGTSRFVTVPAAGLVRLEHLRPYATESETGVKAVQPVPQRKIQIEAALNLDRRHQRPANDNPETAR